MKPLAVLVAFLVAVLLVPIVSEAQERCERPACVTPPTAQGGVGGTVQGAMVDVIVDGSNLLLFGPDVVITNPCNFEGPSMIFTPPAQN